MRRRITDRVGTLGLPVASHRGGYIVRRSATSTRLMAPRRTTISSGSFFVPVERRGAVAVFVGMSGRRIGLTLRIL